MSCLKYSFLSRIHLPFDVYVVATPTSLTPFLFLVSLLLLRLMYAAKKNSIVKQACHRKDCIYSFLLLLCICLLCQHACVRSCMHASVECTPLSPRCDQFIWKILLWACHPCSYHRIILNYIHILNRKGASEKKTVTSKCAVLCNAPSENWT